MNQPHPPSIREIFSIARKIDCPRQREAYLAGMCPDEIQRGQIERLLLADQSNPNGLDSFAEQLARVVGPFFEADGDAKRLWNETHDAYSGRAQLNDSTSTDNSSMDRSDPEHESVAWDPTDGKGCLGPYRLLRVIGEGGVAIVYHAYQEESLQRHVAIKVVKPGMDSRQVLARFDLERDILQELNHSHIASIFDAGMSPTGHPYLVMELIPGETIDEYCCRYPVTLQKRLEWFCQICETVHHAHQAGIIHRDLKPSNIMITRIDGAIGVKLIDFGVAKAMTGCLGSDRTRERQMIGTPAYMSPEQLSGKADAIDIRSDVYSLGALLYALIVGHPPIHEANAPLNPGSGEGSHRGDGSENRPSRQLNGSRNSRFHSGDHDRIPGEHHSRRSFDRAPELARFYKRIKSQLDWIVAKALHPEASGRYTSALSLADDVRRFLSRQPVMAEKASPWFTVGSLLPRKQAHAAMILSLLIVVFAISAWTYRHFTSNGDRLAEAASEVEATAPRNQADSRMAAKQPDTDSRFVRDTAEAAALQQMLSCVRDRDYASLQQLQLPPLETALDPDVGIRHRNRVRRGEEQFSFRQWVENLGDYQSTFTMQHPARVDDIAVIPGRSEVASACHDGCLRIWDLETKTCRATYGPTEKLTSVAASPNGQWVATGSQSGRVEVRASQNGDLISQLGYWHTSVQSLCWTTDSRRLAIGYRYGPVVVSDHIGKSPKMFNRDVKGHSRNESVLLTNDNAQMITSLKDYGFQLWDIETGNLIRKQRSEFAYPREMGWIDYERNRFIAGNVVGDLQVLDTDLRIATHQSIQPDYPQAFANFNGGKSLLIGNRNGVITGARVDSGDEPDSERVVPVVRFQAHQASSGPVTDVETNNQTSIISSGADGSVRVWEGAEIMAEQRFSTDRVAWVDVANNHSVLAVMQSADERGFQVVAMELDALFSDPSYQHSDLTRRATPVSSDHQRSLMHLPSFSFDDQTICLDPKRRFFGIARPGVIELRDLNNGKVLSRIETSEPATLMQISPEGRMIGFVSDGTQYELWEVDDATLQLSRQSRFRGRLRSAVIDLANNSIIGRNHRSIDHHAIDDGRLIDRWADRDYQAFAVSSNRRWLALCGDGMLEIRDLGTGQIKSTILLDSMIHRMFFCDKSRILLSLHRDGVVQAWHVPSGSRLGSVTGNAVRPPPRYRFLGFGVVDQSAPKIFTVSTPHASDKRRSTITFLGRNTAAE